MNILQKAFRLILGLLTILIILGTTTWFTENNALEGIYVGIIIDISIIIMISIIMILRWCNTEDKPN